MRHNKNTVIDVVIPAHEKDLDTLNHCIEGIRKNIADVRRIIVVSKAKYTDKAEWFDEALFPFSIKEIKKYVDCGIGWHFQQLLKLYSVLVIPEISENVVVVDSDTVFLKKVKFFSEEGLPLYNLSKDKGLEHSEFHRASYKNIVKILPQIGEKLPEHFKNISGICHHMLFQKHFIEELFGMVEQIDGSGDPFYKIFLKNSGPGYAVAEYNLYFYFLASLHPDQYKIRILRYKNTADFSLWKYRFRRKYDYCSFHSYMREDQKNFLQKIRAIVTKKISRFFYFEHWDCGIISAPIHEMLHKEFAVALPQISWIKNDNKLCFYADPFGIEIAGQNYVLFENYSELAKKGVISIAPLNSDLTFGEKKLLLDDKKHLSYPFIFKDNGTCFLVCESSKSGKLTLYEIDQQQLVAKKVKDIFANRKAIDPTIIFYNNKFWLFYNIADSGDGKLYISFADSLFGEFKDHPKNPVRNNLAYARSAGTPFIFEDKIYRPVQNCTKDYGSSIAINRIIELSETEFREEDAINEIKPKEGSEYYGFHTLSALGNFTLIDGKRRIFVFYKPLISLMRNLRRIFK